MTRRTAIVVGAGIGGLATALALARAGWDVRVLERAAGLGEVGAGLTLSPNALRALHWLGLADRLAPILSLPPYQISEDPLTGAETGRLVRGARAIEQYGVPYAFVHRADLHATLAQGLQRLNPTAIALDTAVSSVSAGADGASVTTSAGDTLEAALVIGADGLRSSVRAALLGSQTARYTGFVAWRALLDYAQAPAGTLPAGSAVTFGPGRCFVRYRLEPRQQLNCVAFAREPDWPEEDWSVPADPEVPARLFDDWHPALSALLRAAPEGRCYKWGLFDRDPIPTYAYGHLALLGDAAHPMLPFLGQGAALALEDAVVLARALGAEPDVAVALQRYDRARQPRGTAAQLESRAAGLRLHGEGESPRQVNEETLDYFAYDPAGVAI
ncbi:MAG: FAD-dependent monooxygenase [Steroidobacteraceae bacterium]